MTRFRTLRLLVASLLTSAGLGAQNLPDLMAELQRPERRADALVVLRRLGAPAAQALADAALAADRAQAPEAAVLAQTLADLGRGTGVLVPRLMTALPKASVQVRDALLHALGNGLLDCSQEQLRAVDAALLDWARAGWFYSPRADAPTFGWFEYVRLCRRIALRHGGVDADALAKALRAIRAGRMQIARAIGSDRVHQVCDLNSFGQHGTRESLEAIAELALDLGAASKPIAHELAEYLGHEQPRPGKILTEPCAGYGEPAPTDAPEVKLPTLWRRDDWRFAVARTVFAHDEVPDHRQHALRHLLHAPTEPERLHALALVRDWPQPWTAFLPELVACLAAAERAVVRDALVLLGLIDGASGAAAEPLQRIAAGPDPELAARARKILARRR